MEFIVLQTAKIVHWQILTLLVSYSVQTSFSVNNLFLWDVQASKRVNHIDVCWCRLGVNRKRVMRWLISWCMTIIYQFVRSFWMTQLSSYISYFNESSYSSCAISVKLINSKMHLCQRSTTHVETWTWVSGMNSCPMLISNSIGAPFSHLHLP